MKEMLNNTIKQANKATKVLTVTILVTLGVESTTRHFNVRFDDKSETEENTLKLEKIAKQRYTSIMHMGGNVTVQKYE